MVVGHGIEIDSGVSVRGQCTGRTDRYTGDVRGVKQHQRAVRGGGSGIERSMGVTAVRCSDDGPCLLVGDGHAERADIKPNPTLCVDVDHGGRNGIAVIHAGLHTRGTPRPASGCSVPCCRGLTPVGIHDWMDAEGH